MNQIEHQQDAAFFKSLLNQIEECYTRSSVADQKLNYSLAALPISKNKGLIMGINWGGSGDQYKPQTEMPSLESFLNDYQKPHEYKFLKKNARLYKSILGLDMSTGEFNYSNLCFFRTPKGKDLQLNDYHLCLPLIDSYIEYLQPKWILLLGSTAFDILKLLKYPGVDDLELVKVGKARGYKGRLFNHSFACVPHSNYPISGETRKEIWINVTKHLI